MTRIEQVSRLGNAAATRVLDAFNADQERDERGRWGSGGPGSGASNVSEHEASAKSHGAAAIEHGHRGEMKAGRAHALAAVAHNKAVLAEKNVEATKLHDPMYGTRQGERVSAANEARAASAKANRESTKVSTASKPIETRESIIAQANAWRASRTSGAAAARLRSFKGKKMG